MSEKKTSKLLERIKKTIVTTLCHCYRMTGFSMAKPDKFDGSIEVHQNQTVRGLELQLKEKKSRTLNVGEWDNQLALKK